MIHPDTELRQAAAEIGLGVFATRPIPRGTIVWVLDELDQRFSPERVRVLGPRYARLLECYGYLNAAGDRVLCWDLARWMNHSCDPNVLSTGWEFDIAVRDIALGEEITNDYGALNLERSFACCCASPECRRTVKPSDFERLARAWDERVREVFPRVLEVLQPLRPWVRKWAPVAVAARRPERVPSILRHHLSAEVAVPLRPVAGRRG